MNKNFIYASKKQVSLNLQKREVGLKVRSQAVHSPEVGALKLQGQLLTHTHMATTEHLCSCPDPCKPEAWNLVTSTELPPSCWETTVLELQTAALPAFLRDACTLNSLEMRDTDSVTLRRKGQDCLVSDVIHISGSSEANKGRQDYCPL